MARRLPGDRERGRRDDGRRLADRGEALERAAVVPPRLELGSHHERPRGRYEDAVDGDVVGVGLAHPERVGPRSTLERLSLMRE